MKQLGFLIRPLIKHPMGKKQQAFHVVIRREKKLPCSCHAVRPGGSARASRNLTKLSKALRFAAVAKDVAKLNQARAARSAVPRRSGRRR